LKRGGCLQRKKNGGTTAGQKGGKSFGALRGKNRKGANLQHSPKGSKYSRLGLRQLDTRCRKTGELKGEVPRPSRPTRKDGRFVWEGTSCTPAVAKKGNGTIKGRETASAVSKEKGEAVIEHSKFRREKKGLAEEKGSGD